MSLVQKLVLAATLALPLASVACTVGEARYEVVKYETVKSSDVIECTSPTVLVKLADHKACGGGKGHCYEKTKVTEDATQLEAPSKECEKAELCVPDKVLLANGKPLKECTSLGGKPGACTSLLHKQLDDNKVSVPQDVCDEDERCAPCIHPIEKSDTHACDAMGAHEEACTGGKQAVKTELCCHGQGACMDLEQVPEDNRSNVKADTCKQEGQICAPRAMATGKAVKCTLLGAPGVCLDLCFAEQLQATAGFGRSSCNPTEICLPCAIGKGQGMPGCE